LIIGLSFGFRPNGLDLFYNGNLFSHATLKEDFIVLELDDTTTTTTPSVVPLMRNLEIFSYEQPYPYKYFYLQRGWGVR